MMFKLTGKGVNEGSLLKARVKVKSLMTEGIKEQELMLFFNRENEAAPWYMELESSLRKDAPERGKKS